MTGSLRAVTRAADKEDRARAEKEEAIREAHAAGASLREIAECARLSHEQIRRVLLKPPASD